MYICTYIDLSRYPAFHERGARESSRARFINSAYRGLGSRRYVCECVTQSRGGGRRGGAVFSVRAAKILPLALRECEWIFFLSVDRAASSPRGGTRRPRWGGGEGGWGQGDGARNTDPTLYSAARIPIKSSHSRTDREAFRELELPSASGLDCSSCA